MNQMKRWVSLEFRRFKRTGNIESLPIICDSSWKSAQPNLRNYRIVFAILPLKSLENMRTCLNTRRQSRYRNDGKLEGKRSGMERKCKRFGFGTGRAG